MQALDPGHLYEVAPTAKHHRHGQKIQFLKKEAVPMAQYMNEAGFGATEDDIVTQPADAKVLVTTPGTTNEEVLEVLIDRTEWLQQQYPCEENLQALAGMRQALDAFNARTAKRKAQGVEGQLKNHAA